MFGSELIKKGVLQIGIMMKLFDSSWNSAQNASKVFFIMIVFFFFSYRSCNDVFFFASFWFIISSFLFISLCICVFVFFPALSFFLHSLFCAHFRPLLLPSNIWTIFFSVSQISFSSGMSLVLMSSLGQSNKKLDGT